MRISTSLTVRHMPITWATGKTPGGEQAANVKRKQGLCFIDSTRWICNSKKIFNIYHSVYWFATVCLCK